MCDRIKRDTGFTENITPIRFRTTVLTDLYDQTKDIKLAQVWIVSWICSKQVPGRQVNFVLHVAEETLPGCVVPAVGAAGHILQAHIK